MSKISKYLVLVAVILVLGASVVLWRLYNSFTQTARTDTTIDERQAQSRIEAKDANPGAQRGVGHLETVTEWPDTEEYSPVEMAEHQAWMAAHGYFDNSHYYTYGQLTPEQLDVLAQTGDVGALQFRAFGQTGPDPRAALDDHLRAAVHGSTSDLLWAANVVMLHDVPGGALDRGEGSFAPPFDALVLSIAAQLRGDNIGAHVKIYELLNENSFSEAVIAHACMDAIGLYEELERERHQLGLGSFQNTGSPIGFPDEMGGFSLENCAKPNTGD